MGANIEAMKGALICLCVLIVASCSPQRYVQRQLQKHPEWMVNDTSYVLVTDTLTVPEYVYDTAFTMGETDTVILENDSIKVVLMKQKEYVYLQATVKAQKRTYTHKCPVITKRIVVEKPVTWVQRIFRETWVLWLMGTGILISIAWIRR